MEKEVCLELEVENVAQVQNAKRV